MKKKLVGLSVVFLLLLLALTNAQATILKVGTSWSGTQYSDIQSAITAASAGDEIWVEQGTYTPDTTIDISKAISLYGGFTGSETSRDQRSTDAGLTIVDGSTSLRCFLVYSTITIDGFTVTKGNTTGDSSNGPGIWNGKSTINYPSAVMGYLTLKNCIITGNSAGKHAALFNDWGNLTVDNCTFSNNTAVNKGGAINNYGHDMTITNCLFTGNYANNGAAVTFPNTSGTPSATNHNVFTDCVFSNNTATMDGGAFLADGNCSFTRCSFIGNTAGAARSGTIATRGDTGFTMELTNCVFAGNTAGYGAGICINGSSGYLGALKVMNCTFAGNIPKAKGGAIYTMKPYSNTSTVFTVTNSILWGNGGSISANEIDRSGTTQPLPMVSYSDIDQTGYAGTITDSINSDPLFVDAANGDYSLQSASPCINTGTATDAPDNDMVKTSRPQGSGFDMGAYEYMTTLISLSSFEAGPGNRNVTLTWKTESEIENAGFNIYRADEDGEYVKINDAIIPAEGAAALGSTYQFVDADVQNRATYSYKLEDIDIQGVSTLHGPVSATPRLIYGLTGK